MSGVHKHPTISFRVSDREREMIEAKILASGMQKKRYDKEAGSISREISMCNSSYRSYE